MNSRYGVWFVLSVVGTDHPRYGQAGIVERVCNEGDETVLLKFDELPTMAGGVDEVPVSAVQLLKGN